MRAVAEAAVGRKVGTDRSGFNQSEAKRIRQQMQKQIDVASDDTCQTHKCVVYGEEMLVFE